MNASFVNANGDPLDKRALVREATLGVPNAPPKVKLSFGVPARYRERYLSIVLFLGVGVSFRNF